MTAAPAPPPARAFMVAMLNQKGGVGKTTFAMNLAAAAYLEGRTVKGLDLDRQGSFYDWFFRRPEGSRLDGITVVKTDKGLDLPKFRALSKGFDVVICDGPARLGDVTRSAAIAADVVVIPFRPGFIDWWAGDETIELLNTADQIREEMGRPPVRRVFVVNGATSRTKSARDAIDALASTVKGETFPIAIVNRGAYAAAPDNGESVLTVGEDEGARVEVLALWDAIYRPTVAPPPAAAAEVAQ